MMFSLQPVLQSLALLIVLVPSASVVFAQQQNDEETATTLLPSNDNNTDSSTLLMTNYNALREEGQGFYLHQSSALFEKPDSPTVPVVLVLWFCDFDFSLDEADDTTTTQYGYVGRGVGYKLGDTLEVLLAQGAQIATPAGKAVPLSVSAVLVPTSNTFEGQIHPTHDDWVWRYWDAGTSTLPFLGWEGHDQGDTSPHAETCVVSLRGTFTKITTDDAANYLGRAVADMTPATCTREYGVAWNTNNIPDPIATSVTALEEQVAQQQADINELRSLIIANGSSGSGDDGDPMSTSSSPFMAWYKHATTDMVMKSIVTVAVIIGLVVN